MDGKRGRASLREAFAGDARGGLLKPTGAEWESFRPDEETPADSCIQVRCRPAFMFRLDLAQL